MNSSPDQPQAAGRRRRRILARLGCGFVATFIALLLGLAGLEWMLRNNAAHFLGTPAAAHGMYESDGDRSYRLCAGWRGSQLVEGRATEIRVNSDHMRGPEVLPPEPGDRRILLLGDSYVFGYGLADDETLAARITARSNAAGGARVVVGNAGVPGYGTVDMPRALRRHAEFAPDTIVAFTFLGNDFQDDCEVYRTVVDGFLVNGQMARLAQTSTRFRWMLEYRTAYLLERFLDQRLPWLAFDKSTMMPNAEELAATEGFPPAAQMFAGLFMDRRDESGFVAKALQRCRDNYRKVAELAGPARVLHVLIPSWWHMDPGRWRAELQTVGLDPEQHRFGATQARLLGIAGELELDMLDLTPLLRAAPDGWSFPHDRHLTPSGADTVAGWIVQRI